MEPLTVEQKAALCLGADIWHTAAVPEHGIASIMLADGPHGLRAQPGAGDHAGIGGSDVPPLPAGSLPATCFPTAAALASSWDPELAREIGAALGEEARAQGVAVLLGPGVNIKRSPLCGRNFEYLSEDPHLTGVLAAALVTGIQSRGVGTSVKHFAANNQETDRLRVSADVDERTLREIYLPAFEHVITQARPWTVMCAYNKVNGTYASQHHGLLTTVLREEWGFDGVVVSDWGAVADRVAALVAGLDLEMPPNRGVSDRAIVDAVADGSLDEAVLDRTVARMRLLVERAGGGALADVLTGVTDPGGRLAETIPLRLADTPSHLNFPGEQGHVRYGEGVFVGYRGFDALDRPVAHPFGHGLSYTEFAYSGLTVAVDGSDVTVGATVTNTGGRAGREIVQLYVGDPEASVARPPAELRGFTKIALEPGAARTVSFTLNARDLSYWSTRDGGWVLEPGEFEISVGASSRDLRLCRTITVDAPAPARPLTADSTLQEWLADPDGGPALRAAAGPGVLDDAELQRVIGNFPLGRLAAFPGMGITQETLRTLGA